MRLRVSLVLLLLCSACTSPLFANQIVLEGSDATAFHHDALYTSQLFTFMQNGSPLPVLVMSSFGSVASLTFSFPVPVVYNPGGYSLSGVNLALYSAVYIESPSGCCGAPDASTSISAADKAAISAAEAAGLNVSIENYGGGPTWGTILPAAVNALPSSDFGGVTSYGTAGGPFCTDGEIFNATGLSHGFAQPPALGCYEHQGYLTSAFTALGFISLVDAAPSYFGPGGLGSALLALGGPLGTPLPSVSEPISLLIFGSGLIGLLLMLKRIRLQKA